MKAAGIHAGFVIVLERHSAATVAPPEAGFAGAQASALPSEQDNPRALSRMAVHGSMGGGAALIRAAGVRSMEAAGRLSSRLRRAAGAIERSGAQGESAASCKEGVMVARAVATVLASRVSPGTHFGFSGINPALGRSSGA